MLQISVSDPDTSGSAKRITEIINVVDMAAASVADPYHFDTDPDPGCEKIRYRSGSGSRVNFDTDPGKNDTDPDPAKKD